jgi:hypothetical protein
MFFRAGGFWAKCTHSPFLAESLNKTAKHQGFHEAFWWSRISLKDVHFSQVTLNHHWKKVQALPGNPDRHGAQGNI